MRSDSHAAGTFRGKIRRSIRKQSGHFLFGSIAALAGSQKCVGLYNGSDGEMAQSGAVWHGTGVVCIADFWHIEELQMNGIEKSIEKK